MNRTAAIVVALLSAPASAGAQSIPASMPNCWPAPTGGGRQQIEAGHRKPSAPPLGRIAHKRHGMARPACQSRPNPRGRSTSRACRSTSQTPSRSSAVRELARDSGRPSRQASYSAWRVRSWSTASAQRFGRGRRSFSVFATATVRTGSPAARRSRNRRCRSAFVMPSEAIVPVTRVTGATVTTDAGTVRTAGSGRAPSARRSTRPIPSPPVPGVGRRG